MSEAADEEPETAVENPPKLPIPTFRFKGIWRGYQQRLLTELEEHLDDRKLHVVAAPGAGKTLIGLEVLRRLERPALVLSPSLAIRDQWLHRLSGMFRSEYEDWLAGISHRLNQPGWLTSSTYQSLHAAFGRLEIKDDEEPSDDEEEGEADEAKGAAGPAELLKAITEAGVATLVLDEAHHLRRAWWESLQMLVAHLEKTRPDFHIVSLTATPPYDVDPAEWERYEDVCGPIDAEISIPELVRQGDLCPHQDFIRFSFPKPVEIGAFETFAQEAKALVARWSTNPELVAGVQAHPWLTDPDNHIDPVLSQPAVLGGLIVIAAANGLPVPGAAIELLGAEPDAVPPPSARNLTPLLQAILDGELAIEWPEDLVKTLRAELRSIGAISRRKVRLEKDEALARALTRSAGKIESAVEIAHDEYDVLGSKLRLVVLTDYVRADALLRPQDESADRLGAGPILRRMIATDLTDIVETALVTGGLVVFRETIADAVQAQARALGIKDGMMALRPLSALPGWLRFDIDESRRGARLTIMTRLLEAGTVRCLVGTAALLGEGWDAPSINSLVLATSVKSSMLSNQMRGRAIRRHAANPDKTAAIWHLVTIVPPDLLLAKTADSDWDRFQVPDDEIEAQGLLGAASDRLGRDAQMVAMRFKTFSGVTHAVPYRIANGIGRLDVTAGSWTAETVNRANRTMQARAADRANIAVSWEQSVGGAMRMQRPAAGIRTRTVRRGPRYVWTQGLGALLAPLGVWLVYVFQFSPDVADVVGYTNAAIFGLVCLAGGLWWNADRFKRLFRAGSAGRYLHQIGECVLDGLSAAGALHTARSNLRVSVVREGLAGQRICALLGGRRHDESAFVEALAELLDPIVNPRQILVRRHGVRFFRRVDYHAVPAAISASKSAQLAFQRAWKRRLGSCELLSARSRDGRRRLLEARARQFAGAFVARADRLTFWE